MGYREATEAEKERFLAVCDYVSGLEGASTEFDKKHRRVIRRSSLEGGRNIGGLGEKTLHLALKYFFEQNSDYHEVPVGPYFADVLRDGAVLEVQTRNFCSFRKKLAFVSQKMPVTVVHPIIREKRLFWTEPDSGEISGGRISPKHCDIYNAFRELVYIRELLHRENLSFCFPVLRCSEYKLLCGWDREKKKGSVRYNLVPEELLGFYEFDTAFAFSALLPECEDAFFTVKKISALTGKDARTANAFVNVLKYLDILCEDGKEGRATRYVYGENY